MTKNRIMHDPEFHVNKIYMLDLYSAVIVTHVENASFLNTCKIYFRVLEEGEMDWVLYKWFNEVYQEVKDD